MHLDKRLVLIIETPTSQVNGLSAFLQMAKNLPAMQETWVRSLGWEDLLEKGMATYSSSVA